MTDRTAAEVAQRMSDDVELVASELQVRGDESISGAAFRVLRHNIAARPTLDVARVVLRMTGCPPSEQWRAVHDAAEMIRSRKQR